VFTADRPGLPAGLRRVTDADAEPLIALIAAAYDEYRGCILDLPGVDDDLPAPGTTAGRRGSPWWVVERGGELIATIGVGPLRADGTVELKRLYVDQQHRGRGLASQLVRLVEKHAAGLGADRVELWSDSRFREAHRRYAALGYEPTGEDRDLHDPSHTTEHRFLKAVTPATPDATVAWDGPSGRETATLTPLPDGWHLTTRIPDHHLVAAVEVDGDWRTCRAAVTVEGVDRLLTSDRTGRWWCDGDEATDLHGALDVDIEISPLTNTLPIRRALANGVDDLELTAAWVRIPGDAVAPSGQRYTRVGERTWRFRTSTGFEATLAVDEHGLVERYADAWRRT
jgi:GNAT superfamily N-acetyltransferase